MRHLLIVAALATVLSGCGAASPPLALAPMSLPKPSTAVPVGVDIASIGVHSTDTLVALSLDAQLHLVPPPVDQPQVGGWFGVKPGDIGPAVIAAHVNGNHHPGLFVRLGEVKPGDVVRVGRADGSVISFTVVRVGRFPKDAFPTDQVYGNTPDPELRVITCGGAWNPAKRSYEDNIVVFAKF